MIAYDDSEYDSSEDDWYGDEEPPEPIEDDPQFPSGTNVRVEGYGGVAWWVRHVLDGQVVCRMVGDDRNFSFDPSELSQLAREEYCGECGQIGCTHDGYDRED